MAYLISTVEQLTKTQIEKERKDYLARPLQEQSSIGSRLLETDLQKTKALDIAGKIMRSQQTKIQVHESLLGRLLSNAEVDEYLHGHTAEVIYDQSTVSILEQAEALIQSEQKQLKK